MRDAREVAEFGEEKLAVGAFGRAGGGPAGYERVGGHGRMVKERGKAERGKRERSEFQRGSGGRTSSHHSSILALMESRISRVRVSL